MMTAISKKLSDFLDEQERQIALDDENRTFEDFLGLPSVPVDVVSSESFLVPAVPVSSKLLFPSAHTRDSFAAGF